MEKGLASFDAIFYINLNHRIDRKQKILEELDRLEVPMQKVHRIEGIYDPLNGHRGCSLSHILALKEAKKQKYRRIVILEDDCEFQGSKEKIDEAIDVFLQETKDKWDVFLLGGKVVRAEASVYPNVYRILESYCSHSYCIRDEYYDCLIESIQESVRRMEGHVFSFQAVFFTIDRLWISLQQKDRWYMVDVIAQQSGSFSDIESNFRERNYPLLRDVIQKNEAEGISQENNE